MIRTTIKLFIFNLLRISHRLNLHCIYFNKENYSIYTFLWAKILIYLIIYLCFIHA